VTQALEKGVLFNCLSCSTLMLLFTRQSGAIVFYILDTSGYEGCAAWSRPLRALCAICAALAVFDLSSPERFQGLEYWIPKFRPSSCKNSFLQDRTASRFDRTFKIARTAAFTSNNQCYDVEKTIFVDIYEYFARICAQFACDLRLRNGSTERGFSVTFIQAKIAKDSIEFQQFFPEFNMKKRERKISRNTKLHDKTKFFTIVSPSLIPLDASRAGMTTICQRLRLFSCCPSVLYSTFSDEMLCNMKKNRENRGFANLTRW
jgi:hypothetical protein